MLELIDTCAGALFWLILVSLAWRWLLKEEPTHPDYPPISDEEFLALCGPDTDPEIALKVRRIVAEHSGVEPERIHPSMSFNEDLGLC